jgi:ferric-dicitrate binding protein FerR (iron transport regulator)
MSPPSRDEDLISRYFDQALSPAEEQELAQLLQRSAAARALLRDLARVEGMTAHLVSSGVVARTRQPVTRRAARRKRPARFALPVALAAAALVAASLVLLVTHQHPLAATVPVAALPASDPTRHEPPAHVVDSPHIVSCGQEDRVITPPASLPTAASVGAVLVDGSVLSAAGTLTMAWDDGTTVVLHAGTRLALSGSPDAKGITLRAGAVDAEIAAQPPGHPMLFHTALADSEVVGTQLTLASGTAGDRLDVHHGLVRFRSASTTLEVAAGATAVVSEHLTAQLLPGTSAGGARFTVQRLDELESAIALLHDGDTLQLAPGTYPLAHSLVFDHLRGVTLCGEPEQAASTILQAQGGVTTAIDLLGVADFTISTLTIQDAQEHLIFCHAEAGCETPRLMDLILAGARENFIRAIGPAAGSGVDRGLVSGCRFRCSRVLDSTGFVAYLDISGGHDWIVRGCTFEPMRFQDGSHNPTDSAILARGGASGTLCERNRISGCLRGITYGVQTPAAGGGDDHHGGIIRDNLISRAASETGDCGIALTDSPGTQVLGNTVLLHGSYPFAIECRYAPCLDVTLADNLADAGIAMRDGSSGTQIANVTSAQDDWFVDAGHGDLHLTPVGAGHADQGQEVPNLGSDYDGIDRSGVTPVLVGALGSAR